MIDVALSSVLIGSDQLHGDVMASLDICKNESFYARVNFIILQGMSNIFAH